MKFSDIKVNVDAIEQGAWVDEIPDLPGLRLRVRGFGNVDDRRVEEREVMKLPRNLRSRGVLPIPAQDRIMNARLLDAILLDWEGAEDDDGKPIPYSREKAEEYITDKQYVRFRRAVIWAAGVVEADTKDDTEADAGN